MALRMSALFLTLLLLSPVAAQAHKPSDSYLTLRLSDRGVTGQWDIALRDLEHAIGLDNDGDGAITWGELRRQHGDIAAYALARIRIGSTDLPCTLHATDHMATQHSDGGYAVLSFQGSCADDLDTLHVSYRLFFDLDPQHRGLLHIQTDDRTYTGIFSPERPRQTFVLDEAGWFASLLDYALEGAWHIWIGYDHILFLLTLLLPAVLVRNGSSWMPVSTLRTALVSSAKIVTAFTLAHSVTLSLAAVQVVALPTRLVESVIAVSVVLAALNNLRPVVTRRLWLVAFLFGLVHGFGFASVLRDLGLPGPTLLVSLVGFNLGVEVGQLAIVLAFLPLVYVLRRRSLYPNLALPAGSAAIALLGALWLVERAFDLAPLPV